jgi:hypothetical protein
MQLVHRFRHISRGERWLGALPYQGVELNVLELPSLKNASFDASRPRSLLFLHGLLGSALNFRTVAQHHSVRLCNLNLSMEINSLLHTVDQESSRVPC